jgi:lipoyl(octanoyl) transferase
MDDLIFVDRGREAYLDTFHAMKTFTQTRTPDAPDEIWFSEHGPVFTYGKFGDLSHLLNAKDIPVVATDRGGQITYHGPGQLMIYPLMNLRRAGLGIREWVFLLEERVIRLLKAYQLEGCRIEGKPGIYLQDQKICAIGLKVTRGFTYHGMAFNVAMDLSPFQQINPCGYENQRVTDLSSALAEKGLASPSMEEVKQKFRALFLSR